MSDQPVIIVGGSVKVQFDPAYYTPDPIDVGKFRNANVRIKSIEIKDDNTGQTQIIDAPTNGKCTITIHTE